MICRLRRGAPTFLTLVAVVVVVGTASVAVSQVVDATRGSATITELVVDRLAGIVLANITAFALLGLGMWRWTGARQRAVAVAVVDGHNLDKAAHEIASEFQHQPLEKEMAKVGQAMTAVMAQLAVIQTLVAPLGTFETRLREMEHWRVSEEARRDPARSPVRRREAPQPEPDPPEADMTDLRGTKP